MKSAIFDVNNGATISSLLLAAGGLTLQPAPVAKTVSTTLLASDLIAKLITGNQGGGAAASYQLPLASDFEVAFAATVGPLPDNAAWQFSVLNISTVAAEDITITANTGWTLVGSMVVTEQASASPANSVGRFIARRTAANTYTLYRA